MKRVCCQLLLASLFLTGLARAESTSSAADQIIPLLDEQLLAANAHDTDRFLAMYVHNSELVFIANGQIIRGWNALHEQQLKWWKNGKSDVVYADRFRNCSRHSTNDSAPHGSGRKTSDGSAAITTIWRRLPAGWRVTYGHESGSGERKRPTQAPVMTPAFHKF